MPSNDADHVNGISFILASWNSIMSILFACLVRQFQNLSVYSPSSIPLCVSTISITEYLQLNYQSFLFLYGRLHECSLSSLEKWVFPAAKTWYELIPLVPSHLGGRLLDRSDDILGKSHKNVDIHMSSISTSRSRAQYQELDLTKA